jgi:hypothetical protein
MQAPVQIPARVMYSYAAQDEKQLNLVAGRTIILIQDGGPGGWSKGSDPATGKFGFFPSDYVRKEVHATVVTSHIQNPVPIVSEITATALYDFNASKPNEQSFKRGDRINIISRGPVGGWSKGERGIFPTDYVKVIDTVIPHTATLPLTTSLMRQRSSSTENSDFGDFMGVATSPSVSQTVHPIVGPPSVLLSTTPIVVIQPAVTTQNASISTQPLKFSGKSAIDLAFAFDDIIVEDAVMTPLPPTEFGSALPKANNTSTETDFPFGVTPGSASMSTFTPPSDFGSGLPKVNNTNTETDFLFGVTPASASMSTFTPPSDFGSGLPKVNNTNTETDFPFGVTPASASMSTFTTPSDFGSGLPKVNNTSTETDFPFGVTPASASVSTVLKVTEVQSTACVANSLFDDFTPSIPPAMKEKKVPEGSLMDMISVPSMPSAMQSHDAISTTQQNYSTSSLLDFDVFNSSSPINSNKNTNGPNRGGSLASAKDRVHDLLSVDSAPSAQNVFKGSLHSRSQVAGDSMVRGRDRQTFSLNEEGEDHKAGIWSQPFFHDLFTTAMIKRSEGNKQETTPPLIRMANAFHSVRLAINQVKNVARRDNDISEVLSLVSSSFKEAGDVCKEIPIHCNDPQKFADFLARFMSRVKHLRRGEITISPCVWNTSTAVVVTQKEEDGSVSKTTIQEYHGVIILVYRTGESGEEDFSLTVVNTSKENGGLDYHAPEVDSADGSILYNVAFELVGIPNSRIQNTAFWYDDSCVCFDSYIFPCSDLLCLGL